MSYLQVVVCTSKALEGGVQVSQLEGLVVLTGTCQSDDTCTLACKLPGLEIICCGHGEFKSTPQCMTDFIRESGTIQCASRRTNCTGTRGSGQLTGAEPVKAFPVEKGHMPLDENIGTNQSLTCTASW